jgi:hypothetical protein
VEEIEYAMANKRGGDDPQTALESYDGSYHESSHHAQFDYQGVGCPPDHCEQDVIRRNYNRHRWVEGAIAIQSY